MNGLVEIMTRPERRRLWSEPLSHRVRRLRSREVEQGRKPLQIPGERSEPE
jgi:hypothetical protein